jgi:hypothetical protein
MGDQRTDSRRTSPAAGRPAGPRIGPVRVTPTRVILLVAVVGASGYAVYTIVARDAAAMLSAAVVLGVVFALVAVAGGVETVRAARTDRPGRSVVMAVLGGIAGIIAFGCFAAAAVIGLLWGVP